MAKIQIFLDWDGTLTRKDTLHGLSSIGYDASASDGRSPTPWDQIVQAYVDDLEQHSSTYRPAKKQRVSIAEESRYLASLKSVEQRSIKRVEQAGVFKGVTRQRINDGAHAAIEDGKVKMRDGWDKLLASESKNLQFSIVTVNWSGLFVRGCLKSAARWANLDLNAIVHGVRIWSNEIEGVCDQPSRGSSGRFTSETALHTSEDKARLLDRLMEESRNQAAEEGQRYVSIYVGDTATDFDALLRVGYGICIRDKPMGGGQKELAETLQRVGVSVEPLAEVRIIDTKQPVTTRSIYWTEDLLEVARFVASLAHERQPDSVADHDGNDVARS